MEIYGWKRYLGIEKEFLDAQYYVSLDIETVYSEFFTREVILLGAEIEAAFKKLCHQLDPNSSAGNIAQYKNIILGFYPGIVDFEIQNNQTHTVTKPFIGWDKKSLPWWDIYGNVKHGLLDQAATSKVATDMLKAYEVLLICISAKRGDLDLNYIELPQLYMPTMGMEFSIKGENRIYLSYSRKEILDLLEKNNGVLTNQNL